MWLLFYNADDLSVNFDGIPAFSVERDAISFYISFWTFLSDANISHYHLMWIEMGSPQIGCPILEVDFKIKGIQNLLLLHLDKDKSFHSTSAMYWITFSLYNRSG